MLLGRLMAKGDQTVEKRSCSCWVRLLLDSCSAHNSSALTLLARCKMENECLWCEEDEECEECQEHEEEKE